MRLANQHFPILAIGISAFTAVSAVSITAQDMFKLSLLTDDPGVTVYVNNGDRAGKMGKPMDPPSCYKSPEVDRIYPEYECIGDVAIASVGEEIVEFWLVRDEWKDGKRQMCSLQLLKEPESRNAAFVIDDSTKVIGESAAVLVECDTPY